MFLKKMVYARYNLIQTATIMLMPLLAVVFGLLLDLIDQSVEQTEISDFSEIHFYPNPIVVAEWVEPSGGFDIVGNIDPNFASSYENIAIREGATLEHLYRHGVEHFLLDNYNIAKDGIKETYVAAATFNEASITAWFNRRLLHGSILSLNLIFRAVGKVLSDVNIRFVNKPRNDTCMECAHTEYYNYVKKQTSFIMYYMCIAIAIFIIQPIYERTSHIPFFAGINIFTYWLSHLIWDYLIFLPIALSILFALFKRSIPTLYWMIIILLVFGLAALSFTYLISFLFKDPTLGALFLIFLNIVTVLVAMSLSSKITNFGFFTLHSILLLIPVYALFSATFVALRFDKRIRKCPKCNDFLIDNLYDELVYMAVESIIYFILVLLISYYYSSWDYLFQCKKETCDIEDEEDDVRTERLKIDKIVKDKDSLKKHCLVCNRIQKRHKKATTVECISLRIKPYQCLGLLGLNGAGKTSAMNMIVGADKISEGDVYIAGHNMKTERNKCYTQLGHCPLESTTIYYMTGREMLRYRCLILGIKKSYIPTVIESIAESFALTRVLDQMTCHYSKGSSRKLSIALAALPQNLICLDEPTKGVDIFTRNDISNAIRKIHEHGKGLLITSHEASDLEKLCSHMAIMVKGKLFCYGSIGHLRARYSKGINIKIKLAAKEEVKRSPETASRGAGSSRAASQHEPIDNGDQSNEKGIQVNINREGQTFILDQISKRRSVTKDSIQTRAYSRSFRKSVLPKWPTSRGSYTSGNSLNIYIRTTGEYHYWSLILEVEHRFKTDFLGSYVSETLTSRGEMTVTIPEMEFEWSFLFAYMEEIRDILHIKYYSISETSLQNVLLDLQQANQ